MKWKFGLMPTSSSTRASARASLGGARPKASFSETNGSLWIAKFPAHDDTRDVGAWEARQAGVSHRRSISTPTLTEPITFSTSTSLTTAQVLRL